MIGILDYRMGNLRSVQKAFEAVGHEATIVAQPEQLASCDRLVLPGVGAFADGMSHLQSQALVEPVKQFIATGRPVLGICLGMQLLFESSQEGAPSSDQPVPGMGTIPGRVVGFCADQGPGKPRLKVPHMGWNALEFAPDSPLFAGLTPGGHVYFVHGYYCTPADQSHVAATTSYGHSVCAAAHRDNLWAMQFHPEKSQHVGLQILKNFAAV